MKRRSRGPLIGGLALAMVATLGGIAVLPDQDAARTGQAAGSAKDDDSGLLSRIGDAARGLVNGGPGRAKPEVVSAGLFRDEKPLAGKKWPEQKRVRELTGKRTANSRVYQLSDGRTQAEISAVPLHYRDAKGRWQSIDTRVRPTSEKGYVQGNRTNAFTSLFGDSTDDLVRFEADGRSIELGLAGAAKAATPKVSGSTVTYAGLAGGADVVYDVTSTALKEKIVLRRAPGGPVSYTFTLDTAGLTAQQREDGSIAFVGKDGGEPVFVMPAPFMYDSKDDKSSPHGKVWSDKVTQTVTQSGGTSTITITADAGWLADPARVYPVVIDPTIKVQPVPTDAQDVAIYSGASTTNYNDTYQLKVGTDASNSWRSLVKFDVSSIPANTPIDDARLQMYYSQTHYAWGFDVAMEARRVTSSWSESTANWSNMNANMAAQPAGNMVTKDDGDSGTSVVGTWSYSGNTALTPLAINGDYRYNNDTTTGHSHTWVPTITESGDYQVEVHFVTESDRPTNAPYTVYYNGGSKTYSVDQTGSGLGEWKTLGVHPFAAGTTGKVVLGDVSGKSVIADAVRFTRWGVATKKAAVSNVWSSFPVRNVVQDWVNNTQPNHGFMVKAVDEAKKGRGGPIFEASEFAYNNARRDYNLPKLVVTYGRPGVTVNPPTTITSTGAVLDWPAYVDPSTATGDDAVEYQVHRSIYQNFTPSSATLIAPVSTSTRTYQDTTAIPTAADNTDPLARKFYYYMVAVKTRDGQVIAGPTQSAILPKAGQITRIYRTGTTDTTLSAARPTENVDVYDGDPYVSPGNNSSYYGDTHGLVKFPTLTGIPTDAKIVDAELRMYNTGLYPGTDTDEYVDVYKLKRNFTETKATWNTYDGTNAWTTAGGDYDTTWKAGFNGFTNDPEWETWDVTPAVDGWVKNSATNYGLLLRQRDEVNQTARAMLLSSEGQEPLLRPTLEVTYLEQTAESTYYAASTPTLAAPNSTYTVPVTLSNPTLAAWNPTDWELAYDWKRADGTTDGADTTYELKTPLPKSIPAGGTVDVSAQVKTPPSSTEGNKRTDYVLQWDLRNKLTGKKLSETTPAIQPLPQNVAVEEPTSDQLGLEKFYSYAGKNTGAGGTMMNNLYSGNTVWSYNAISNPSRGLSTFVRMSYNSLDTTDTVAGYGWSLQASSMMRLGAPLDFHPNPNPTKVTLTDGDGTSHWFTWDATANEWKSPKGVHLYLQKYSSVDCKPNTEEPKAWVLTRPDRTQFFYDCEGFLSSIVDNNGNEMLFTYEERKSNNKPTKFLKYLTDPTGRITLTIDYYAKGQTYDYIDDTTWNRVSGATNLTNPHIIDHVSQITDISGRKLTFTYTDKGLLGELVDGAGSSNGAPKTFKFAYDMTQGNKNVKLVKVTDPRGNASSLVYNYPQTGDDPKFHWTTKSYTDRLGHLTQFGYVDPDGPQGNNINATVTDAENHATAYQLDGYGRAYQITNAKNEVTKTGWDDDHNVIRLEEANGAVSTWAYDPKTGYPTEIKDAEAVKNGWPGTVLTYQRQLNGYVAEVISKTSSEGRKWTFTYTGEGDIETVTDPLGNTTATAGDYTSTNTYDEWGQLLTAKDANGNTTAYGPFHASGYPTTITDAGTGKSYFTYDDRGNVTEVKNGKQAKVTQDYDTFGRPTTKVEPMDAANNRFITTKAPVYDLNDNITTAYAANGAVSTSVYDKADQVVETLAPKDEATDPERKTTTTYDKVGNVLTVTEPQGNLTSTAGDYTTTTKYDAIYQPIEVTNGLGQKVTSEYDNVGNVTVLYDAKKTASAADDFTTKYEYDLNHRVVKTTDALGKFTTARYDKDGLTLGTTDADGNESLATYDARGALVESKVPHDKDGSGTITYRTTKYEYDQVGNQTKAITPRGVSTTDDADDFAVVTVYDALNRKKEEWSSYDKDDSRYNTPDKTFYTYDEIGNLTKVSAPPSDGQTVRNDTEYTYYDNGWTKTSKDPWDIVNSYDYNDLGQQTKNTLSSAGGSTTRTMTWEYYQSGNEKGRSEDGLPVGKDVVLVDNTDSNNTASQGTWTSGAATGAWGYDVSTAPAGSGSAQFNWQLNIPRDGSYEVFVRHPQVSGAATDAKFTITHNGGSATKTVNQTQNTGAWISLGSYSFVEDGVQKITLTDQATGKVLADAVKLVRDNTGDVDNEKKEFTYRYNPNGLMVEVKDLSPGAKIDRYDIAYDELSQISSVKEFVGTATEPKNTTALTYDENGNPLTSTHDLTWSKIEYDERDMVAKVTNADSPTAGNQQISTFTYTARGQMLKQTKPNGNTVDFEYYLDGATKHQLEKTSGGATVAEHTLEYQANGHPSRDVLKLMNADNSSDYIDNTYVFTYDPQDRIAKLDKTGDSTSTESYTYDANGNTVEQTVDTVVSKSKYDRNRLHSTTTGGVASTYNYDPLGRLDTVSVGGQRAQKYYYDGFDRTAKTTSGIGATAKSTTYVYDPFDRTVSQTTASKTTIFTYLGMDNQVLREEVAGKAEKSYQYAPWGQQLTQIKHKDDGSREYSQFIYRPRGDVVGITKEDGKTRATYGYTAYGKDDESQFTGVDKPGSTPEGEEPYNAFRFNASRWDANSGTYDMGFRNYDPGLNRFLTRDTYGGALADMGLAMDPFTGNRYAFAGGNPISFIELDGHLFGMSWSDIGHAALDVAGMVPVIGEVADVANGIWYAAEGNYVDAALSMASAIPLAGNAVAAAKLAKTGKKIADGIDTAKDVEKGVEATTDATRAAPSGTPKPTTDNPTTPTKCNSFVPGTRVLLASGGTKAIEDLKLGDQVLGTDVESGENQGRTVTNVRSHEGSKTLVTITVDVDGKAGSKTGKITSTAEHLIWLPDAGQWVTGGDLKPGMWLQTAAGTWVQITAISKTVRHERVHNLTVEGIHTYYVLAGDSPVLVHNCPGGVDANGNPCTCSNQNPAGGTQSPTGGAQNLTGGHSPAAQAGQNAHTSPDWAAHLNSLGYHPGGAVDPKNIPDGFTRNGYPVELKPDTASGVKAGTRRLRRYMNAMGKDYGELWLWSQDSAGNYSFRLGAVPKPGAKRKWLKF